MFYLQRRTNIFSLLQKYKTLKFFFSFKFHLWYILHSISKKEVLIHSVKVHCVISIFSCSFYLWNIKFILHVLFSLYHNTVNHVFKFLQFLFVNIYFIFCTKIISFVRIFTGFPPPNNLFDLREKTFNYWFFCFIFL